MFAAFFILNLKWNVIAVLSGRFTGRFVQF